MIEMVVTREQQIYRLLATERIHDLPDCRLIRTCGALRPGISALAVVKEFRRQARDVTIREDLLAAKVEVHVGDGHPGDVDVVGGGDSARAAKDRSANREHANCLVHLTPPCLHAHE